SARAFARLGLPLAPAAVIARRADPERTSVVIACPGVGRIPRGYETFADQLARRLQRFGDLDVRLLQGGPVDAPWARRVAHLDQAGFVARAIARLARTHPKYVEHISFGVAALPRLLWLRPDLVIVSEHALASVLDRARALPGLRHRIAFNNGGLNRPPLRAGFDVVQEVTQHALDAALRAGGSAGQHVVLPLAVETGPVPPTDRRPTRRRQLDLPTDRRIVISVGQLDRRIKRMDLVVQAVAGCGDRPYLVLLGQRTDETPALEALAQEALGIDGFRSGTVAPHEVGAHLEAADAFVLASAVEGFGRVYLEALSAGLPCVVDDNPVAREVCGPNAAFVDCSDLPAFSAAIGETLDAPLTTASRERRWRWARDNFGWDALEERYHDHVVAWAGGE
ncbi:MAG: glycosyltransferase family 4 protein, partial [Acidimicrobiia bacterium]|nr:glycosyltransferase family 4 protein [Acidimicrobiia bacterium]